MENVNRLLLENVLPAHVAAHFIGDKLNEVWCKGLGLEGGEPPEGTVWSCAARCFGTRSYWQRSLREKRRRKGHWHTCYPGHRQRYNFLLF